MKHRRVETLLLWLCLLGAHVYVSESFTVGELSSPQGQPLRESRAIRRNSGSPEPSQSSSSVCLHNKLTGSDDPNTIITSGDDGTSCWNPRLRRVMGGIAACGAVETAYLTWSKLSNNNDNLLLCGAPTGASSSGCSSVLDSSYALVPGTEIPLSLLGFIAYSTVAFLALVPALSSTKLGDEDELENRLLLAALSTTMGIFSVFLMEILFGVLKEPCPFCVASAAFSITLAKLSWIGGAVPSGRIKQGIQWSATGGGLASLAASLIFFSAIPDTVSSDSTSVGWLSQQSGTTLLASSTTSSDSSNDVGKSPPPILSSSSVRALDISKDLQARNARMFGAYWCSHCYDQKERLGKEAMSQIPYVECSREGMQSQAALCKQRDVPGYPTWEINGKLYPGEKELDELEEIIRDSPRS